MSIVNEFQPYEGEKPYIFISYAHADSPEVMRIVSAMHDNGYRIWYDEGIEVGSEWPECIASHLAGAHLMLAFVSNAYMASDNCRRETHYALSKKIKIINIWIENTKLTPGMEMQTGNIFALMQYSMPDEEFFGKLYNAPLLRSENFKAEEGELPEESAPLPAAESKQKKQNKTKAPKVKKTEPPDAKQKKRKLAKKIVWLSVAVVLLAAVITLGIIGHFTGLTERVKISLTQVQTVEKLAGSTAAQIKNEALLSAATEYTGLPAGELKVSDLAGITELYICANQYTFEPVDKADGQTGELRDLSDLKYFSGLQTLYIQNQSLSSLETLPACDIRYLNLSSCKVASLQGIGKLPKLRELTTEDCPVMELGDISRCLQLRSLTLKDARVSDFSQLKPLTSLNDVSLSNSTLDDLLVVLRHGGITHLELEGCDLRGNFFHSLDSERKISYISLMDCELSTAANIDDYSSLTELHLIGTGGDLDWTELSSLSTLSKVYVSADSVDVVTRALAGTSVQIINVDAQ